MGSKTDVMFVLSRSKDAGDPFAKWKAFKVFDTRYDAAAYARNRASKKYDYVIERVTYGGIVRAVRK